MKEYSFETANIDEDIHDGKEDHQQKELERILACCDFIVITYSMMFPKESISGVRNSIRGMAYELTNGNIIYWYEVSGGYKLNRP